MSFNLYEASKSLCRINLNLGSDMHKMTSFRCCVVLNEYNPTTCVHSLFELHLCLDGVGKCAVCGKKNSLYTLGKGSELCGFVDRFTIRKFFVKHEGMPPGELRKSNRR